MGDNLRQLYRTLRETQFECVSPGFHDTTDVYQMVQETYPQLCNDELLCSDVCGTDKHQPEWKHRIRTVQQDLVRSSDSRVRKLSNGWYYGPQGLRVASIHTSKPTFEVGQKYNRWELHDEFGGQRYSGIATPAEFPLIFIFTGDSGEVYGYEDEFLEDDSFLYTGEGVEGDMEMSGGNKAIRYHQEEGEEIHLFEDTEYPWIVTYVGQFEYTGHQWDTLQDQEGRRREAIRFRLEPIGGTDIEIEAGSPSSLSEKELFEKAKQSTPSGSNSTTSNSNDTTTRTQSTKRRTYTRSAVVKEFALRDADGICQGCEEPAPFLDTSGEPFLEVHHLHRRSDGGPDDPENVIAICPNCHRRVHLGEDSEEFNRSLIEKSEERNEQYLS